MVIKNWVFTLINFFMILFSSTLQGGWGADSIPPYVDISPSIDLYQSYENTPLKGTVLVTHDADFKIDSSSFQLDNKPLKVAFIKNEKMSAYSSLEVSIYNFELPPQPKGLYLLPSISVILNGNRYFSIPISYEVSGSEPVEGTSNASLALKSYIEGPANFYPGQRGRFVYRFYYTGNIELNKEYLPLLEAKGFKKIGGKQVKDFKEGALNIEEVSQEIEALKPGEYSFPVSYLEGQAYREDSLKKRSYFQPALKADTADLIVKVLPFPSKNKPASFNGAVGKFILQTSLSNPSKVYLGDKIELTVAVTGTSNLYTVHLPDLQSQQNFQGLFRLGDLPPSEEIRNSTKYFKVELRPASTAVTEIPAIEFSYFDPDTEKYDTIHSRPIPLSVSAAPTIPEPVNLKPIQETPPPSPVLETPLIKQPEETQTQPVIPTETPEQETPQPPVIPATPSVIEIQGNYPLTVDDIENRHFGSWWILLLIPFGIIIIGGQKLLRDYLAKNAVLNKSKSAHELFNEAMQTPPYTPQFFDLLNKAFLQRLVERGEILSSEISPEKLSSEGIPGTVRTFLCDIEERRFSGTQSMSHTELVDQALTLFNKL